MCVKNVCVQKKEVIIERANQAAESMFVHEKGKKIHSLFSVLIPPLYKTCSKSNTIFSPLCSTLFTAFRKETFFLPLLIRRHRKVVTFDFHHTLSGWPEGPCVTYLYYARFLCLSLSLSLALAHYRGSQNSHMRVSKATNQDLCPERVDRRWMEEHETVAALTKHLYLLLVCCNITHKLVWDKDTAKVKITCKLFFFF